MSTVSSNEDHNKQKTFKRQQYDEKTVRQAMNLNKPIRVKGNDSYANSETYLRKMDELRIHKQHIFRFRIAHTKYILLFFFLFLLQLIGIIFFSKGFLLTRQVLDDISSVESQIKLDSELTTPYKFDKAVILIIDALRFDFVIPQLKSNEQYHNKLTILDSIDHKFLYKFISDPPTTTLQRLKGLTTGSLPTFIDAGSNFNGELIEEDNLIKQLALNNRTIKFAGDDTWKSLFNPYLHEESEYFESLNVFDLDTVDNGVINYFNRELHNDRKNDWDVLIGHMLGVDHVGHKHGPNHEEMSRKLTQMDDFITDSLLPSIDEDTVLFIFGDHGMDHTGNHGGDSKDELETTLFVYSPQFESQNKIDSDNDKIVFEDGYQVVNQIDFIPTFAMLTDIPIPFNNLGWPISNLTNELGYKETLEQIHRYNNVSNNIDSTNFKILDNLFKENKGLDYQQMFLSICQKQWAEFDMRFIVLGLILLILSLVLFIIITKLIPSIVLGQIVHEFVPSIFIMCTICTVSFNAVFQILGQFLFLENWINVTLFGLCVGILLGCFIPIFDRYNLIWFFTKMIEDTSDYWTRAGILVMVLHFLVFTSNSFTIWEDKIVSFLITTVGVLTFYEFVFIPKRQSTNALFTNTNVPTQLPNKDEEEEEEDEEEEEEEDGGYYGEEDEHSELKDDGDETDIANDVTSEEVLSEDAVITDDEVASKSSSTSYMDNTKEKIKSLRSFSILKNKRFKTTISKSQIEEDLEEQQEQRDVLPLGRFARILGCIYSLLLILSTRFASLITICREEQGDKCIPTFINANNYSILSLAVVWLICWILPFTIKSYYHMSLSYQAAAPIWINGIMKVSLMFIAIYWTLNYFETHLQSFISYGFSSFNILDIETVHMIKFNIVRILFAMISILLNIAWACGPICIKLDLKNTDLHSLNATILGYNNVYGSQFFLIIINFLLLVVLFNKPLGIISITLLTVQLLSFLEIINLLKLKENVIGPVTLALIGYQHFFTTGHQATIPSVQWDIGFMINKTIKFPITHIAILINTFGPFIIIAISVALITLWRQPPKILKPQTLLSRIVSNTGILIIYNTLLCLSNCIFVAHFRRHLMVWKIFCPRFLFSCMTLIIIDIVIIFVTIAFASGRVIRQVDTVFWN
ncbi:hypothetical protein ACO0SA_003794 [Hanseniaspora valbyensis]